MNVKSFESMSNLYMWTYKLVGLFTPPKAYFRPSWSAIPSVYVLFTLIMLAAIVYNNDMEAVVGKVG